MSARFITVYLFRKSWLAGMSAGASCFLGGQSWLVLLGARSGSNLQATTRAREHAQSADRVIQPIRLSSMLLDRFPGHMAAFFQVALIEEKNLFDMMVTPNSAPVIIDDANGNSSGSSKKVCLIISIFERQLFLL